MAKITIYEIKLMTILTDAKDIIKRTQWEIRRICFDILRIFKREAPNVFEDFEIDIENFTARLIS